MGCGCDSGKTIDLKIAGDVGADPVWCNRCGFNLEIADAPILNELAEELSSWAMEYGKWINWDVDKLVPNGVELEVAFNQIGATLTEKVKREIGNNYKIKYSPSTSAIFYSQMKSN